MWARVMEVVLACWLVLSQFIFRYDGEDVFLRTNDLACAAIVVACSFLSFWRPLRYAHLAILPVALWLLGYVFLQTQSAPPHMNYMVVGMLWMLFALVPNYASEPPQAWLRYVKNMPEKS